MNCAFSQKDTISFGNGVSFVIEEIIGIGASSIVYRAKRLGIHTEHLLKEYHPSSIALCRDSSLSLQVVDRKDRKKFQDGMKRFEAGYSLQMKLRENQDLKNSICNVQAIYEGYGTKFIDMTYFSGKSYDKFEETSLRDLLYRIREITKVISLIHQKGYLYLDIKPSNIFSIPDSSWIMLFDFDSVASKADIADPNWQLSLTRAWAAPELEKRDPKAYICEATDLYSIGMMLFYKLTGKFPEKSQIVKAKSANYSLDTASGLLKGADEDVLSQLTDIFRHTVCSLNYRWSNADMLVKALNQLIHTVERSKSESTESNRIYGEDIQRVGNQLSKLNKSIFIAAVLICIPIVLLAFRFLTPEVNQPSIGDDSSRLHKIGDSESHAGASIRTDTAAVNPGGSGSSEAIAVTESDAAPTESIESAPPTESTAESVYSSSPDEGSGSTYLIDTIAYTSENFRSLIVTNDGVVYYLDGNTIFNTSDSISIDMLTDFDTPLKNGYLAYDPYNDIVYLLAGGSLSIYDITDLSNPQLVIDSSICPGIPPLAYTSSVTCQIAVLPDGTLLIPADLDGTYRVDISSKHCAQFTRIYNSQSSDYGVVIGDYILELREGRSEANVIPMHGGQEYTIQLECNAPYKGKVCAVGDNILFYANGMGICQISADGAFSVSVPQEDIKIKDYQSLSYTNIWSIAANCDGVIAFYDNTLKCIRYISPD